MQNASTLTADQIAQPATEKAAKAPKAPKAPLTGPLAEMKGSLDGISAITKAVPGEAGQNATNTLRGQFAAQLATFGAPVARGNTVYVPVDGPDGGPAFLVIDITPGKLARV